MSEGSRGRPLGSAWAKSNGIEVFGEMLLLF